MKTLITIISVLLISQAAIAQPLKDVPGSKDLEGLPRVANTKLVGYKFSEYDVGRYISGTSEKNKAIVAEAEGERHRYVYAGTPTQTPLQLIRNYQKAFRQYGAFAQVYECQSKAECPKGMMYDVIWPEANRLPLDVPGSGAFTHGYPMHKQTRYFYATVEREGARFHVSGFAVLMKLGGEVNAEIPLLHLEVIKEEDFSDDLEFVSSSEMLNQIESTGSVALYGITFEFDSAALTPASAATVAEIAKLLSEDANLQVYVVGHTDNQGGLAYNEGLSAKRAGSVVTALVNDHGIAANRLTPRGVGPLAPVASNASADGQALNRRVEIVKV